MLGKWFAYTKLPDLPFEPLARVIPAFIAGILIYQFGLGSRHHRWFDGVTLAALLAVIILPYLTPYVEPMILTLFAVILLGLGTFHDRCLGLLRSRPLLYLGDISYSLYMTHTLVQKLYDGVLTRNELESAPIVLRLGIVLVAVAMIAGVALFSFYFIEEPSRRWLRDSAPRLAGRRPTPSAAEGNLITQ